MQTSTVSNPFALLTHPEVVLAAIEASERLSQLHSRVWRPLDKPLLGAAAPQGEGLIEGQGDELAAFDAAVDAE